MIVSIHQPNYLPWLGFFDKIKRSDLFVIFDDVQFPRGKNISDIEIKSKHQMEQNGYQFQSRINQIWYHLMIRLSIMILIGITNI